MTHGTLSGYIHAACRCPKCVTANRIQSQKWRDRQGRGATSLKGHTVYTPEERQARKACLICQTPLLAHPLRACWRNL